MTRSRGAKKRPRRRTRNARQGASPTPASARGTWLDSSATSRASLRRRPATNRDSSTSAPASRASSRSGRRGGPSGRKRSRSSARPPDGSSRTRLHPWPSHFRSPLARRRKKEARPRCRQARLLVPMRRRRRSVRWRWPPRQTQRPHLQRAAGARPRQRRRGPRRLRRAPYVRRGRRRGLRAGGQAGSGAPARAAPRPARGRARRLRGDGLAGLRTEAAARVQARDRGRRHDRDETASRWRAPRPDRRRLPWPPRRGRRASATSSTARSTVTTRRMVPSSSRRVSLSRV